MKKSKTAATQKDFFKFIATELNNGPTPNIANLIIKQFGGWEDFQANNKDLFIRGGHFADNGHAKHQKQVKGWDTLAETSDFYTKNKAEILMLAKSRTDQREQQTVIELVSDFRALKGAYDLDMVAVGMHLTDCEEYPVVSSALACFAANQVSHAYSTFTSVTKR